MDGRGAGGHCLFPLSAFDLVLFYWKVRDGAVQWNMDKRGKLRETLRDLKQNRAGKKRTSDSRWCRQTQTLISAWKHKTPKNGDDETILSNSSEALSSELTKHNQLWHIQSFFFFFLFYWCLFWETASTVNVIRLRLSTLIRCSHVAK